MDNNRRELSPLVYALALVFGVMIGFLLCSLNTKMSGDGSTIREGAYSKFSEVMRHISDDYVDTVNLKRLEEDAIAKMMEDLDPHSQYISEEEFNEVTDPLKGSFEGIGVSFRIEKDTITIINPIKGGPSDKVGILAGDRIVRIDDTLVAGVKIRNSDAMRMLKGPRNTKVNVSVLRRGVEGLMDYTITRGVIPSYSIDVSYMLDDDIGYIRLSRFSATTYKEFVEAIAKLKKQGMKKLVFDLRGNFGGFLSAAVEVADEFLPKGSLIVYTEGRNRPANYLYARKRGMLEDMPVAVLIDGESASASEILAGTLQDNDRGVIIGRRSFGKGLVQEQISLRDNSAIRLTVARYYTPTGRSIQKPFDGDIEKYMLESYERYQNGELFYEDSIHFADSLKYVTPGGKVVYGGGGIMPDVYVPIVADSTEFFFNILTNRGVLSQYAFDYADMNRVALSRYKTIEEFKQGFHFTDPMFEELIRRGQELGIEGSDVEKRVARSEANILFKAYVARNLFDDEGFYPLYQEMDDILQRAIKELSSMEIPYNQ